MSNGNVDSPDPYMALINTIGSLTKHRDAPFISTAYAKSQRMVNNWIGLMKNLDLKNTASISRVEKLIDADWDRISASSEDLKLTLETDYRTIKDQFLNYKDANTTFYQAFGEDGYYEKDNERLMEILENAGTLGITDAGEMKKYSDELSGIVKRYNKDRTKLNLMFKDDYKYMTEHLPKYERQHQVLLSVADELKGTAFESNEVSALYDFLAEDGNIEDYKMAHNANVAGYESMLTNIQNEFGEDSLEYMRLDSIWKDNERLGINHPHFKANVSYESPNPMKVQGIGYEINPNTKEQETLYWYLPSERYSAEELVEKEQLGGKGMPQTYESITKSELEARMELLKASMENQLKTYDIKGKDLEQNRQQLINSAPHLFDMSSQKAYLPWNMPGPIGFDDSAPSSDGEVFVPTFASYEMSDDIKDTSGKRIDWRKKRIDKLSIEYNVIVDKMANIEEGFDDSKVDYEKDMARVVEIEQDIKDRWAIAKEEGKAEETGVDKVLKAIGYTSGWAAFTYGEVRRRAYKTESGKAVRKLEEEKEKIIQKWKPTAYSGKYTTKEEWTKYQKEIGSKKLEFDRLRKELNRLKNLILTQETSIRNIP